MSMNGHQAARELRRAQEDHASLDEEIVAEQKCRCPDSLKLQGLKRRKLRLKERITELQGEAPAMAA